MSFRAPVTDLVFSLEVLDACARLSALPPYRGLGHETVGLVLRAAGQFAEGVLAPINSVGDLHGASLKDGAVRTAPGFAEAYRAYVRAGWPTLCGEPDYGGQRLPRVIGAAVFEIMHGANMAFGLCPMLTQAAVEVLQSYGNASQKRRYLPPLTTGNWTGTMNLTEAQSGSDLGRVQTRAEPDGNGGWLISGEKIFITWGDHDLSENIVHLVLARMAAAPPGSKGLSLFIVPKHLVPDIGMSDQANAIKVSRLEKKLGIHGSPTCAMTFNRAQAELIGEPHRGLPQMFTMMNSARLQVGLESVGIAERAYQQALRYALERRQGRSAWTGSADAPIFDHPDIRRMLSRMKAYIEAARGICLATALAADVATTADHPRQRREAKLRLDLLTPLAKAWSSDMAVLVTSMAVQVHGGAGYVEECGAAQHLRDARITPIYEGTNGIQAIDLVERKLTGESYIGIHHLLLEIRSLISSLHQVETLRSIGDGLQRSAEATQTATEWIVGAYLRSRADALAGASTYLRLLGNLIGGASLASGALLVSKGPSDSCDWRVAKQTLAMIYCNHVLSKSRGLAESIMSGARLFEKMSAAAFGVV